MNISDFPRNDFSLPKVKKKCNFNILFVKIKNKQKNGVYVLEAYLDIYHAKFQVDISVFGKHIAKKKRIR